MHKKNQFLNKIHPKVMLQVYQPFLKIYHIGDVNLNATTSVKVEFYKAVYNKLIPINPIKPFII